VTPEQRAIVQESKNIELFRDTVPEDIKVELMVVGKG